MSTIITCECGASVRIPENRTGRQFRCPKCKAGIALATGDRVLKARRLDPGQSGIICQICQTEIGPEEGFVACPQCEQTHHVECWSEIGGCGTYGCTQAPSLEKSESSVQAPLTGWGDTKTCPACKETIKSIALKCRHCGTEFKSVDPMTLSDLKRQRREERELGSIRTTTVGLFVASLIGCLAPLVVLVSLIYFIPRRDKLRQAGPQYIVMGYAAIAVSAMFSVALLLFGLAEVASR